MWDGVYCSWHIDVDRDTTTSLFTNRHRSPIDPILSFAIFGLLHEAWALPPNIRRCDRSSHRFISVSGSFSGMRFSLSRSQHNDRLRDGRWSESFLALTGTDKAVLLDGQTSSDRQNFKIRHRDHMAVTNLSETRKLERFLQIVRKEVLQRRLYSEVVKRNPPSGTAS